MKKIYALLASCMCLSGFGQDNSTLGKLMPSITRPSPTVAQLMKVEESTLDHYNGQPQIAVPLFSTKAGNLDVGLTLSYNSSGIRVSEQSGWVGKGWSLEAGGVISRSVVDMPDEIETEIHKGTNSIANKAHNIFNLADNSEERKEFAYDAQWGTRVRYDTKTDVYQFSFFGRTGRFSFTKVGGNGSLIPVIIGNDGDYKIEAQITSNPLPHMYPKEITTFVITDDTGNRYYFSALERTKKKDISLTYMQEGCDDPTAPITAPEIPKFITAWHLSKVEDANGIELLNIAYVDRFEKPAKTESRTDYVLDDLQSVFLPDSQDCTKHMKCALEPRTIISESYREIDTKRISRISFPDGSSIGFSNTNTHPEYGGTGSFLTKVEIYNPQDLAPIRSFDFAYSNTTGGGPLFLNTIKTNGSNTERYAFEYYKTEQYPFGAPPEERDIFGYARFEPQYDAERTGVLTKISYPTKGVREFEWEPNTYSYQGSRQLTFKEIFQNPDNYDATPVVVSDSYMNTSNNNVVHPFRIFYVSVEQDAKVVASTHTTGQFIGDTSPNAVYIVPILSEIDQTVDTSRPNLGFPIDNAQTINTTIHLMPGAYKVYLWSMNFSSPDVKIAGSVRIMAKTPRPHLNWFLYGGGLRIRGIKDRDRDTDQIIKSFSYNFQNPDIVPTDLPPYPYLGGGTYTLTFSSGSLDGSDSLVRESWTTIEPIFNLPPFYIRPPMDLRYHITEQQSDLDAQLQKGSFIGYKNVFEFFHPNVPPSINGVLVKSKIKYTFDSPIDFPSIITTSSPPLPVRGDEYKQSNVRKIEYYNSSQNLVASEDFKYNYDTDDIKIFVKKNLYFITNASSISGFCHQIRKLYKSYHSLKTNGFITGDYSRDCNGGPSSLATTFQQRDKATCLASLTSNYMSVDDYRYKSQMVESTKKEYFPSGIVETKQTFAYKIGFKRLQAQTSISSTGQLLETKYFYPDDSQMAAGTTPYKADLIARNMIGVQLRIESYRNGIQLSAQETKYGMFTLPATPAIGNALLPQSIHTSKGSNSLEKKLTFDNYDSRGNITQYTQDSGVPVSFVWGYGKTLPLAKIDNIAYAAIPTGLIAAAQGYSDGTTYNEASLLSALEDLRIYTSVSTPGGMMTGYSYKPLVGITATIDPKGERTYYEYDAFGRLRTVRDQNGKLISENKYHYRTQN